jgi:lysophospholipase L1-like esterase
VTRLGIAAAVGLITAAILTINAGSGEAQDGLQLRATAGETGRIALRVEALPGLELTLRDELTGAERRLTPRSAVTVVRRFAAWSCAASLRRFTAEQTADDGSVASASAEVRTPGCRRRLELVPPRSVRAPGRAVARLRDRWRLGDVGARLCVMPPGAGARCRPVRIQPERGEVAVRVRALRAGGYRIAATNRWQRLRAAFRARPAGGRLHVLATGDSMVQIIDSFLAERVGRARVRSDARVSTGLSKPSLLNWPAHARRQAASRPDAVVMFIGANDGFAMGDAPCCGAPWVAEYARRARAMMRTYARGGRARVYWLLLPAARSGIFRETFPAVNAGIRRAAQGLGDDVRLVELDEFFTPGGRYRSSMTVDGRVVRVRQDDGVHLNTTGASLAATLIARAMRRDRILR